MTADGIVGKVRVRLNTNTKSRRCTEMVAQKKSMHVASFSFLISEVRADLIKMAEERGAAARLAADSSKDWRDHTLEGLMDRIVGQCMAVLLQHKGRAAGDYAKDSVYRSLVTEALDVKSRAMAKFRLWLDDKSQHIFAVMGRPLRRASRDLIAFLKHALRTHRGAARRAAAMELCKMRGLVEASVEELNEEGEDRLTSAAADGLAVEDLRIQISAAGLERLPVGDSIVSSKCGRVCACGAAAMRAF